MAAYIKNLQDASRENIIYPITKSEAVYRNDTTSVEESFINLETEIYGLDAIETLSELGIIDPATDSDGAIFTDENGNIFSL